jgi:soluble lytic murein transglycosylase
LQAAADSFATVGRARPDPELNAAGHYWAARADMMCGRPGAGAARLRSAARMKETFYGMLAARRSGIAADPGSSTITAMPNGRHRRTSRTCGGDRAGNEIGERALADQMIAPGADRRPRSTMTRCHLAADLNLAGDAILAGAQRAARRAASTPPRATRAGLAAARGGWRVDKALAFAHALQESNFRTAGGEPRRRAGLMQVRPGTAGDMAARRGEPSIRAAQRPGLQPGIWPAYLEYLRDHGATGGLLPKVIAAYNAGPAPVAEWNAAAIR